MPKNRTASWRPGARSGPRLSYAQGEKGAMNNVPNVSIQVLCSDERSGWINPQLVCSLLSLPGQIRCTLSCVGNYRPHEYARNVAAQSALKSGADWLLMIDNDQTLPSDFVELIRAAHRDPAVNIVSCYTWAFYDKKILSVNQMDGVTKRATLPDSSDFQEIAWGGSGVMLIRRAVLENVPRPWFHMPLDPSDGRQLGGEDGWFCCRARDAGFKVHTHSRYPCGHLKTANLQQFVSR